MSQCGILVDSQWYQRQFPRGLRLPVPMLEAAHE